MYLCGILFAFGKESFFIFCHIPFLILSCTLYILLSFFSHSHVVSNLYNVFLLWNTKEDILKNVWVFCVHNESQWGSKCSTVECHAGLELHDNIYFG